MRDYLLTTALDRDCLYSAKRESDLGGTWLPWRGTYARAERLNKRDFLKKAGVAAMPPHVLYVITELGREELAVAAELRRLTDLEARNKAQGE